MTLQTELTVVEVEAGLGGVGDSIVQARSNVVEATEALDAAENKC